MKRKYIVTIEEMISQDFEIEADSIDVALETAEQQYKKGIITLSDGNLVCKQISATDNKGDSVDWYEF